MKMRAANAAVPKSPDSRAGIGQTVKLLPFGPKANRFICRSPAEDARINVLVGSVRSSKTWALNIRILALCQYSVAGQRILTGVSKQAIYQNVLNDLFEIVGDSNYTYNRMTGELWLFGTKWLVIGAHDEGSEKRIRGMTVGIAVCDELVLMPRNFFMMLLSRMSPAGSRLYGSSNPDSPYHWLKEEILDGDRFSHGLGKDVWWQTWSLNDNPNLSNEYKEFLKRSYVGVWHARYVEGLWVLAEGSILSGVLTPDVWYNDTTRPVGLLHRGGHMERFVSIDVGTVNSQVAGDFYDDGKTLFLENEAYFDSRKAGFQKTNAQYATDLIEGDGNGWPGFPKDQREWPGVIVDPSAASFKVELLSRGVFVMDANNEVADGIRRLAAMLGNKKFRIHERCIGIRGDLETYAWDEKAAARGEEKPIKDHDHGCDVCRYAIQTKISDWRIAA